MSFHVGQKVVLVNAKPPPGVTRAKECPLPVGTVCTVREIDPCYLPFYGMVGVRIHEHTGTMYQRGGQPFEAAFLAHNFRPVIERKTDISIFTAMLTPNRVNA